MTKEFLKTYTGDKQGNYFTDKLIQIISGLLFAIGVVYLYVVSITTKVGDPETILRILEMLGLMTGGLGFTHALRKLVERKK